MFIHRIGKRKSCGRRKKKSTFLVLVRKTLFSKWTTKPGSKSRPYLIKEIKEMLPWPLVPYFRSHFIHKSLRFLQGLHRQALGLHNSDNLERSFSKNKPNLSFFQSFTFIESSCRSAQYEEPENLQSPPHKEHAAGKAEFKLCSSMRHMPLFLLSFSACIE